MEGRGGGKPGLTGLAFQICGLLLSIAQLIFKLVNVLAMGLNHLQCLPSSVVVLWLLGLGVLEMVSQMICLILCLLELSLKRMECSSVNKLAGCRKYPGTMWIMQSPQSLSRLYDRR